ncbi:MAG: hypothetical protein WD151_12525 [Phycisphaeraceae bacterium]
MATSATRVPDHTAERVNERIHHATKANIDHYARHPEQIDQRLQQLDAEWDIERTLETNAAALALTGVLLGAFVSRRWLFLPGVVAGFLLQHGLQGWCPPVPLFRRMGVRTPREIEAERYALKAIRGDFGTVSPDPAGAAMAARITDRLD